MDIDLRHDEQASRYELWINGELVGVADYVAAGDRLVLPHTEVAPSYRGRGLAAELVRYALDDIRRDGRTVVPTCWYVAQYIDAHPEYRDLVA